MKTLLASWILALVSFGASFSPGSVSFDARNSGLGRLGVAATAEVGAIGVNPALACSSSRFELSFGAQPFLQGSMLASAQVLAPFQAFAMGLEFAWMKVPSFDFIDAYGARSGESLDGSSIYLNAALAGRLVDTKTFQWGAGVQGLFWPSAKVGASPVDLGAGTYLQFNLGAHRLALGASLLRILGDSLPGAPCQIFVSGLEARFFLSPAAALTPGVEYRLADEAHSLVASLEASLFRLLALRVGYGVLAADDLFAPLSVGAGFRLSAVSIDYAFRLSRDWTTPVHAVTAKLSFAVGGKKK
jgi:hypothetical protein